MKRYLKKYTSLRNYIAFLRRQPEHVQHIYAVIFAGSVTAVVAFFILYIDYGFWHERYIQRNEIAVTEEISKDSKAFNDVAKTPSETFSSFFKEANDRFKNINISSGSFLTGKESYSNLETVK